MIRDIIIRWTAVQRQFKRFDFEAIGGEDVVDPTICSRHVTIGACRRVGMSGSAGVSFCEYIAKLELVAKDIADRQ